MAHRDGTLGLRRLCRLAAVAAGWIGLALQLLICLAAIPIGIAVGIHRGRLLERARSVPAGPEETAALAEEVAAREQAERKLAANRELVANVSHELRTPASLIRAHLEAIAAEPDRADEYIPLTLREADRLERLVDDLFELARLDSPAFRVERAPFDVAAAVHEAVAALAEPARRETGVSVRGEAAIELCARGDRARLVQVLENLVRNAIRYTPEGGIVLVSVREDGGEAVVEVRDTGCGIAPEDLPLIFERFYRGERSRSRAEGGAGLGLAIAKRLVEAMGGSIAVESAVGEGSVFTIRLPRVAEPGNRGAGQPVASASGAT